MAETVAITAVRTVTRRIDATDSQGSVKEGVNPVGPETRVIRVMYKYDETLKLKDINRSQVVHSHDFDLSFCKLFMFSTIGPYHDNRQKTNKQINTIWYNTSWDNETTLGFNRR